ncbi:PBSX family phage terminase large subunit, partial [Streptococcus pneumoniae]
DVFDKIDFSIRAKGIQNRVILVLNPATKEHFIYKRFFEQRGVQAGTNDIIKDTTYIHTTYLDNYKHLSESFITQVEQMKLSNPNKYNHVIMG